MCVCVGIQWDIKLKSTNFGSIIENLAAKDNIRIILNKQCK